MSNPHSIGADASQPAQTSPGPDLGRIHVVCRGNDVPIGQMRVFSVAGADVLIIRTGTDEFHAVGNDCTHAEAELDMGQLHVKRCEIECPLHGGRFDFRTGAATAEPCEEPLATYPVTLADDAVQIVV